MYEISMQLEGEHARQLQWVIDTFIDKILPFTSDERKEGLRTEFDPPVSAGEMTEVAEALQKAVHQMIKDERDGECVLVIGANERAARILRWVVDYIGSELVAPIVLYEQGYSWGCPYSEKDISVVWTLFWVLIDKEFPKPDGSFDLSDLTMAWELGLQ